MILLLRALMLIAAIALWVYCLVDVIKSEPESTRYLHKLVWLAMVIVVPAIGSLAWLFLGRPEPIGSRLIPRPAAAPPPPPDDSPEFLAKLDDEIKRRRRAEQLRRSKDIDSRNVDETIDRLEKEFGAPPDEDDPGAS